MLHYSDTKGNQQQLLAYISQRLGHSSGLPPLSKQTPLSKQNAANFQKYYIAQFPTSLLTKQCLYCLLRKAPCYVLFSCAGTRTIAPAAKYCFELVLRQHA